MAIDFTLAPEHEEIRPRVRAFVDDDSSPAEAAIDDEDIETAPSTSASIIELRAQAQDAGLWLPHMPEEWGGMGLGHVELAMVQAEAAKAALWARSC